MPQVETQTGICASCGALTDTSLFGDESTCMACLLRLGFADTISRAEESSLGTSFPDHIGPYVIARRDDGSLWQLGHGAMGITFRATDESLQRPVALKIINTNLASRSAQARERFMREARAAGALRHPNVATVYQFGVREESGQFFYAMELVEGETLEEHVRCLGPLDVLTTIDIALQVTAALQTAEERGLVHRDLKPGNLMLVEAGDENVEKVGRALRARRERTARRAVPTVKVIDFGVAKAVAEKTNAMSLTHGGFVGTPAFASPEQFTNAPVDVRSDIYSLGATLWFLLTGHMLFSGRTVEEVREARRSKPLPIEQLKAAHVPRRFTSLLMSMLAVEPAARPAGARELAAKLQAIRTSITGRGKVIARLAIAAALVAFVIIAVTWNSHRQSTATVVPIPEKSIAVLPFGNLSEEKANEFFADGMQDEILADLAKIADLKVISRTSVTQYKSGMRRNLREIGRQLGVAHVVEGSVQRVGNRVRVNAQLIDARNDAHLWAQTYDRDLADVFAIQSEISQAIVAHLKAALSPAEKAAIEEKPTEDKEAYDLYLRARALIYEQYGTRMGSEEQENSTKAIPMLESAIARDPSFTLAYCVLGEAQMMLFNGDKAKEAIDTALRISPNSAEAHRILAEYFIRHSEDVSGEKELAIAAAGLPGRAEVFNLRAGIEERRGQWKDALRDREKAVELDPHAVNGGNTTFTGGATAEGLGDLYLMLRMYGNAERLADHMIAITPQQATDSFWRQKSFIALARGDTKAAMAAVDANPLRDLGAIGLSHLLTKVLVVQREYAKAEEILQSANEVAEKRKLLVKTETELGHGWRHGLTLEQLARIARFRGEKEKARGRFEAARRLFDESLTQVQGHNSWPDYPWIDSHARAYIAEIDAALGRKEDAIREARNAVELWPLKRDATLAPDVATYLAIVYMWSGERDAALQQLAEVAKLPVLLPLAGPAPPGLSAGDLKLNPLWDELRNDPRFDKIVAEAAKPIKLD